MSYAKDCPTLDENLGATTQAPCLVILPVRTSPQALGKWDLEKGRNTCGGGGAREIRAGLSSELCSPGRLDRKPPALPLDFSLVGRFMLILHARHRWHLA